MTSRPLEYTVQGKWVVVPSENVKSRPIPVPARKEVVPYNSEEEVDRMMEIAAMMGRHEEGYLTGYIPLDDPGLVAQRSKEPDWKIRISKETE